MAQMGRPRRFDRDKAVDQALQLFWEHGYEATSLNQLKAGIADGISAPSFYAAFGSKEALFRECAQRYLSRYALVTECLWDNTLAPRAALESALRASASMQCERGHPKGCMVALAVMSAPSPEHSGVTESLTQSRNRTRAGITACLKRGIASGELAPQTEPQVLAAVFDGFLIGISTLARDGVGHRVLDAAVDQIMAAWDAARPRKTKRISPDTVSDPDQASKPVRVKRSRR